MKTLRTIRDHLGLLASIPKMKSDVRRESAQAKAATADSKVSSP